MPKEHEWVDYRWSTKTQSWYVCHWIAGLVKKCIQQIPGYNGLERADQIGYHYSEANDVTYLGKGQDLETPI